MARRWGSEFQEDMPGAPTPNAPPDAPAAAPAQPTAPADPGTPQAGQQQTGMEQDWDSPWENRARKILGDKVGSREDLQDPEHRKWINRKLRKHRAKNKAAKAATTVGPETEPETGGVDPPPEPETGGIDPLPENLPTAQGSQEQVGEQLGGIAAMPERRVPGEQTEPMPEERAGREEQEGEIDLGGGRTPEWGPEMAQTGGNMAGEQAAAFEETMGADGRPTTQTEGDQLVTSAGTAPPNYPQAETGGNMAQPQSPWTSTPVQPTYYTGGM